MKSKTLHIILIAIGLVISNCIQAQVSAEQQVIASGGGDANTSTIQVSYTIGEALIATLNQSPSPVFLNQGFQQSFRGDSISFILSATGPLCQDRSNGFASLDSIMGCQGPYTVSWSSGANGNFANNLAVGSYTVQVTSDDGCSKMVSFEIDFINDLPCLLKFYTGITPNEDGLNDKWIIDNLELFPDNEVDIYNRLGNRVWEGENYDNINVVWEGENLSGAELPSDTYFYVFVSGSQVEKGWIELTR